MAGSEVPDPLILASGLVVVAGAWSIAVTELDIDNRPDNCVLASVFVSTGNGLPAGWVALGGCN